MGSYAAQLVSNDSLVNAFSTTDYNNVQVQYARCTSNCTSSCQFICEWYNGSSWTTLEDQTGNSPWTVQTFTLPASAANNANFQLRFRTSGNGSTNYAYLDAVSIIGQPIYGVIPAVSDVSAIKDQPDATAVTAEHVVVTATFGNAFYMEATDRHVGIQVDISGNNVAVGQMLGILGNHSDQSDHR